MENLFIKIENSNEDLIKEFINVEKSFVHQHTRKTKYGKISNVSSYYDSRSFEPKDKMRIQGIIDKARGNESKEEQLAQQMANKITSVAKAERRAFAAEDKNYHNIAKIFYDRVEVLRGNLQGNGSFVPKVKKKNVIHTDKGIFNVSNVDAKRKYNNKDYNNLLDSWDKEVKLNTMDVPIALENFIKNNNLTKDEVSSFFAKRNQLKGKKENN